MTQYCVDFQPNIDVTAIRKKLIADNRQNLGPNPFGSSYIFDGGSLYLCISFPDREIHTTYNGSPMTISLRRIGSVDNETRNVFQLYNNILRDAMAGLRLQNIRRDYYDPHAKVRCSKLLYFASITIVFFFGSRSKFQWVDWSFGQATSRPFEATTKAKC